MKFLLAVDQVSPESKTIQLAKQTLSRLPDAELVVVYVSEESASVYYRTSIGTQHVLTERELAVRDRIETSVVQEFRPWSPKVRFRHETGSPARRICSVAREEQADIVILGCPRPAGHGERVGGVVRGVLNHLDRPVLIAT